MAEEWPLAVDDRAKARIRQIGEEQETTIYEVIRILAEEGSLEYFRGRSDDPARVIE